MSWWERKQGAGRQSAPAHGGETACNGEETKLLPPHLLRTGRAEKGQRNGRGRGGSREEERGVG